MAITMINYDNYGNHNHQSDYINCIKLSLENSRNPNARHSTPSVIYVLRVHKKVRGRDIVFESNATSYEIMKRENRVIKIFIFNTSTRYAHR